MSHDKRMAEYDELHEAVDAVPCIDSSPVPTSGSAEYDLVAQIGVDIGDGPSLAGALDLVADFDAGTVDGRIDEVLDPDESQYAGVLDPSNGTIGRTTDIFLPEFTTAADLDGVPTAPDGTECDIGGGFGGEGGTADTMDGQIGGCPRTRMAEEGHVPARKPVGRGGPFATERVVPLACGALNPYGGPATRGRRAGCPRLEGGLPWT